MQGIPKEQIEKPVAIQLLTPGFLSYCSYYTSLLDTTSERREEAYI